MAVTYNFLGLMEALSASLFTGSDQSPYRPIHSENGEIRLLELWPGDYEDPLRLSLHTVKLEEEAADDEGFCEQNLKEEVSDEEDSFEKDMKRFLEYGSDEEALFGMDSEEKASIGQDSGEQSNQDDSGDESNQYYSDEVSSQDGLEEEASVEKD